MTHHNKSKRQLSKSLNFKILDFVQCEEWDCPSNTFQDGIREEHSHALIYKQGALDSSEISKMKEIMTNLGYEGDFSVGYTSGKELKKILKKRDHNLKMQQKIIDQTDAEFMATIQEREE